MAAAGGVGLPEGVVLAPEETLAATGEFRVSNILFFLRWRMAVTNRRLIGRTPNTILGIIPLGSNQVSYPLANIADVATRRAYSVSSFLIGLILLLAGLGELSGPNSGPGAAIVLIVLGLLALAATIRVSIQVTHSGGQKFAHGIAFSDRSAAQSFVNKVNTTIATYGHQEGGTAAQNEPAALTPPWVAEVNRKSDRPRSRGHWVRAGFISAALWIGFNLAFGSFALDVLGSFGILALAVVGSVPALWIAGQLSGLRGRGDWTLAAALGFALALLVSTLVVVVLTMVG
jgi:hypothetical protein